MSSDSNMNLTRANVLQHLSALLSALFSNNKSNSQTERCKPLFKLLVVLLSKNFSGRHNHGLKVVVDSNQTGHHGDNGFSGADITLDKAVHRLR